MSLFRLLIRRNPDGLEYTDIYSNTIRKIMTDNNLREAYFIYREHLIMLEVIGYNFFDFKENWFYLDSHFVTIYFVNYELVKNHFIGSSSIFYNRNVYFLPFAFKSKSIITSQNSALMRTIDNEFFNIFAAGNQVVSWIKSAEEPVLQSNSISFTYMPFLDVKKKKKRADGNVLVELISLFFTCNENDNELPDRYNQLTFYLIDLKESVEIEILGRPGYEYSFFAPINVKFFQVTLPFFSSFFYITFSKKVKIDNIFLGNSPLCGNRALFPCLDNYKSIYTYTLPLLHVMPEFINYNSELEQYEFDFVKNDFTYLSILYVYSDFYQNLTNIDYIFNYDKIIQDELGASFIVPKNATNIKVYMEKNDDYNRFKGFYIFIKENCYYLYNTSLNTFNFFSGSSYNSIEGDSNGKIIGVNSAKKDESPESIFLDLIDKDLLIKSAHSSYYEINPLTYVIKFFEEDFDYLKYYRFSLIPRIQINLGVVEKSKFFSVSLFDRADRFNYFCLYSINIGECVPNFFYANDLCAYQSRGVKIPSLVVNKSFINPVWQPLKKNINNFTVEFSNVCKCLLLLFLF